MEKTTRFKTSRNPIETRQRLIGAAVELMLLQGYSGTSVDEICARAGLTKGSFFHYFSSKEAICGAALEWWGEMGTSLYAAAWGDVEGECEGSDSDRDPLERLHQLLDIMVSFTTRSDGPCVCMVGMISQELAQTHPALQEVCTRELDRWSANVCRLLTAAKERHTPARDFDPAQVAWFLNSLWQGSMLVGKTCDEPQRIRDNLTLARQFIDGLFQLSRPS